MSTVHVSQRRDPAMLARLKEAFKSLTVAQRQALFLYGVDQRPIREVAYQLGMTTDMVRAIFAGACQRLSQIGATQRVLLSTGTDPRAQCPPWCGGNCHTDVDHVVHQTDTEVVEVTPELLAATSAAVEVAMTRVDMGISDVGQNVIRLDVTRAETLLGDGADMSPPQARNLAAALVLMADMADVWDREARQAAGTLGFQVTGGGSR